MAMSPSVTSLPPDDFLATMFKTRNIQELIDAHFNLWERMRLYYAKDTPPDVVAFFETKGQVPVDRDLVHMVFFQAVLFVGEFRRYVIEHHRGDAQLFLRRLSQVYYAFNDQRKGADGQLLYPTYTHVLGEMRTFYLGNIWYGPPKDPNR